MKVWVLMGNDYPEAVFADELIAESELAKIKEKAGAGLKSWERACARIYWRLYPFDLEGLPRDTACDMSRDAP